MERPRGALRSIEVFNSLYNNVLIDSFVKILWIVSEKLLFELFENVKWENIVQVGDSCTTGVIFCCSLFKIKFCSRTNCRNSNKTSYAVLERGCNLAIVINDLIANLKKTFIRKISSIGNVNAGCRSICGRNKGRLSYKIPILVNIIVLVPVLDYIESIAL